MHTHTQQSGDKHTLSAEGQGAACPAQNDSVYLCVYVCMYDVCTCVCMYVRVCMCVCIVYMYACMYACMYVCVHVCMYQRMQVCTCVCMYVCMYLSIYLCMYVCTRTFNNVLIGICAKRAPSACAHVSRTGATHLSDTKSPKLIPNKNNTNNNKIKQ